ncbi:HAD family phosphatase [Ruminococcus sp. Marseille-P6503]|uniref:HAD family hydrolase n=1 Tax=Ruminococcus sp. Marseille-P6503 TaxID=2364796 RepID=UPI000F52BCB7|nr:HAD family phosphatase [Ruminococcus sp. Marseille-P6503]
MDFTQFKGIIFDLDGTLVDSSHVWSDIDEKFMAKRGIDIPADYFKKVSSMNFNQAAQYTIKRFGLNETIESVTREWYTMAENEYAHNVFVKPGADAFLRYIKSKGIKIALATASSEPLYSSALKNNGIYDLFDCFASTDQVKRGKGFPDVYELACGGISLKPEDCAVFEDIIEGIHGAKAGSFTAVACLDRHYAADWEDMKREADFYFSDYRKLMPKPVPVITQA